MSTNRVRLFTIMSVLLIARLAAAAEEQVETKRSPLVIVLRASRSQVPAGVGFGISADITNKSDQAVFLVPKCVTMTPPPEIDPGGNPNVWYALLPGMRFSDDGQPDYNSVVRLGSGDTTSAFWAGGHKDELLWKRMLAQPRLLNFSPGEYNIRVVALFWADEKSAADKVNNYDSENAEIKLTVVAPQWVIIVGSIVGGLIAYLLLPTARLRTTNIDVAGIFTAILLSTIVTVLLARVSETQFLVRITVNDFWGAVAIGFIANASGIAIIKRYVPSLRPPETSSSAR